jgi:hypothetical protein
LPPSFAFVAAACAVATGVASEVSLGTLKSHQDWDEALALARRHRVEGLVHAGLARAGFSGPARFSDALEAAARAIAAAGLVQAAETARLQGALREAGVESLVLKGVAVDLAAYGRIGVKSAKDIDLLVAPQHAKAALDVLERAGYVPLHPSGLDASQRETWIALARDWELIHPDRRLQVELHWRVVDTPFLLPALSVADGEDVAITPALSVRALQKPQLFAYLCVHGATHGWARLKWIADVNALLGREGAAGIERIYRQSLLHGAGLCAGQSLMLCRRLFGLALPPTLAAELDRDWRVAWLGRVALHAMARGGARELDERPMGTSLISLSQFLLSGRWRNVPGEIVHRWARGPDLELYVSLPAGSRGWLFPWARALQWLRRRFRRPSPKP